MQCITITTFSMILNEKTGDNFQPERGSREGDPIAPYIIVMCVEYLRRCIHFVSIQDRLGIDIQLTKLV